jgi:cytochrome c oxidase cbb3-type subunit 3
MYRAYFLIGLVLLASPALAEHDGEHLYIQNCAACHGINGDGGMGVPLSLPAFLDTVSDDYLRKTIRHGRPGRVMPSFTQLDEQQVTQIIKHMRNWSSAMPPHYSTAKITGDVEHGKQLYTQHCAACHGENATGGHGTGVTMSRPRDWPVLAPALNNAGFLAAAPDEMIRQTLINGRPGTPMVSFTEQGLSLGDIDALVAYLRSLDSAAAQLATGRDSVREEPAVIIKQSPYSVQDTVNNLKDAVVGMNFRLIRVQNLDSGLVEESHENDKQVIVYSCNFNLLNEALKVDPRVGLFLPCRVTVFEHEGEVLVAFANPKRMSEIFNNNELDSMCSDMRQVYEDMIDEALL